MSHLWWHCGRVGIESGKDGPFQWPKFSEFIVAWKLNVDDPGLKEVIENRAMRMAHRARRDLGKGGDITELMIEGDYCTIGIGTVQEEVTIPPFDVASDFLVTYAFQSESLTHAEASALDTWLNIQRYKMYLAVHRVTGGEIHLGY